MIRKPKGIKRRVLNMYGRELRRLCEFSERRGWMTVKRALSIGN